MSRFGYRIALGELPLDGHATFVGSLGLGLEHTLLGRVRALVEYDWLWTERRDPTNAMTAPEYGDGHRIQLGVRRVLLEKHASTAPFRLWIDGELGGGAALLTDNLLGVRAVPDAFAGLRCGYDLHGHRAQSRTFVAELVVRAIVVDRGIGTMFGVGMYWGN